MSSAAVRTPIVVSDLAPSASAMLPPRHSHTEHLVVSNVPDRLLVYSNEVYLNPGEHVCLSSLGKLIYVQLNDAAVYVVRCA